MSSLKAARTRKALCPSCAAGTPLNDAVRSGSAGESVFRIVPTPSASASSAPEALLKRSLNVSASSSTVSSMSGTDTVFPVSPGLKVSVPVVAS